MPSAESTRASRAKKVLSLATGFLAFEAVTGLLIAFGPFSITIQHMVLVHTAVGLIFFLPYVVAQQLHAARSRQDAVGAAVPWSGILAAVVLLIIAISGVVLAAEGWQGTRISYAWRTVHLWSTYGAILLLAVHMVVAARRRMASVAAGDVAPVAPFSYRGAVALLVVLLGATAVLAATIGTPDYDSWALNPDYEYSEGDTPFAPSEVTTADGTVASAELLGGSAGCGTSGCHKQIYDEWAVSAHRYSSMDLAHLAVQDIMVDQEGAAATRYCGGCHDPISLLAGYKDASMGLKAPNHEEGVSCVVCHRITQVDVKGNASYVLTPPEQYLFESETEGIRSALGRFLIRTYPRHHVSQFKVEELVQSPEFCGSCHKQFIDQEINNFGWVQLQNQYDDWKEGIWNNEEEPEKTLVCQQCHMRLVEDSTDPTLGDPSNPRRPMGQHHDHGTIAANQVMPALLELDNASRQIQRTEDWLEGKVVVPETADVWPDGPIIPVTIIAPDAATKGDQVVVRVAMENRKVGHQFPTGPLDLIEAWVEFVVTDGDGRQVFHSGLLDDRNYIEPDSFILKAEPITEEGGVIERHELWQMVGTRSKRALFPGKSDSVEYKFTVPEDAKGELTLSARLRYRKFNQASLDAVFPDSGLKAPVTDVASDLVTLPLEETVTLQGE